MPKKVIDDAVEKKEYISVHDPEEIEIIQILERTFGYSENGCIVFEIKREKVYSDKDDSYYWGAYA